MSTPLNLTVQNIQNYQREYLDMVLGDKIETEDLKGEVANLIQYTPFQVWWEAEHRLPWDELVGDHLNHYIKEQVKISWNKIDYNEAIYLNCIRYILNKHGHWA